MLRPAGVLAELVKSGLRRIRLCVKTMLVVFGTFFQTYFLGHSLSSGRPPNNLYCFHWIMLSPLGLPLADCVRYQLQHGAAAL